MKKRDNRDYNNIWIELILAYLFPALMFTLAIVPGLNSTYSVGVGWLVIPLCCPYVLIRALVALTMGSEESRRWYKWFFKVTIPSYIVIALPLSWVATESLHFTFGETISSWKFFAIMVSPFPWWYFV